MTVDPYAVLGVAPSASAEEIQRAYRAKAKQSHPDLVAESERGRAQQEMAALNEAYGILSDPAKRAAYDARQRDPLRGIFGQIFGEDIEFDLSDLFERSARMRRVVVPMATLFRGGSVRAGSTVYTIPPMTPPGTAVRAADGTTATVSVGVEAPFRSYNGRLAVEVTLWPSDLIGGCDRTVPDPAGGTITVTFPVGSSPEPFVVREHGLPEENGKRGGLVVLPVVEYPAPVGTKARDAARRLSAELDAAGTGGAKKKTTTSARGRRT